MAYLIIRIVNINIKT